MIVVEPIEINDSNFTSSTVTEADYAEWSAATMYNPDDYVMVTTADPKQHKIYKALDAGNNISAFTSLGASNRPFGAPHPSRHWDSVAVVESTGDVYASAADMHDIYKQSGGVGAFVRLNLPTRLYRGIAIRQSTNDIYVCVENGDIYKQSGGVGSFVALGQTSRSWKGLAIRQSNGDIYAVAGEGDIYISTTATPTFTGMGQTSRYWSDIAVNEFTGNVYATTVTSSLSSSYVYGIYMQTNYTGAFVNLLADNIAWVAIAANQTTGDVYAAAQGFIHGIFQQTAGVGPFVSLAVPYNDWGGLAVDSTTGNVYACQIHAHSSSTGFGEIFKASAGNVNYPPADNPLVWLPVSSTNRWKMFDVQPMDQTTGYGTLTVVVAPGAIDTLYLGEMDGALTATVSMTSGGVSVYSKVVDLAIAGPIPYRWDLVLDDLPQHANGILTVTLTGSIIKIGLFVVGLKQDIGGLQYGFSSEIVDFSRKEMDVFGRPEIIERGYANRLNGMVHTTGPDTISKLLAGYRATPVLWSDDNLEFNIFGIYNDFGVVLTDLDLSICALEVEGLL